MKRQILTVLFLVLVLFSATGQRSESEIALREYFIDAEFFLAQEFYMDALNDYLQVYQRGYEDNANINYRIGICYLNIPGQKDKAIPYFEKAAKSISDSYKESSLNEKNAPIDVYLYLGNAFRVNNRLDEAVDSYLKYKELLPKDEQNLHKYADAQIEACNIANDFMASPLQVEFKNLGEDINSSNDDYKAVISGDGSTLVYMHKLPFYDAAYFSRKINGVWSEPENITPQIMSDGDQFVCGLSYDGKTLLLTREDEFNSDIMISRFEDNRWSVSQPLGSNVNTKYWESHASLSGDGKTLYFASNRRSGAGEMDLFYAEMEEDGTFGDAINISELNTELNEDTPFITVDGKMLFFCSQGYTSMGGYDIFVSHWEGTSWGLPKNLGYPISTTDDNLFYYPMDNGKSALFARLDDEGFGGMDIFKVDYKELPLCLIVEEPEKAEEVIPEPEVEPEPEVIAEEVTPEPEEITEEAGPEPEVIAEEVTPEPEEIAEEAGPGPEEVVTEPEEATEPEAVVEVARIDLQPVLFGFDKYALTEEGKKTLDKLAKLLANENKMQVVLIGYADPLGPENYNLVLSRRRAESAMKYLVGKGIDADQLKAIGKGETDFIAINTWPDGRDNPKGRRFNRRVEFEIQGLDQDKLIIQRIDPVPPELKVK